MNFNNGKSSGVGEAYVALRLQGAQLSQDLMRMKNTLDSALGQRFGSQLGKKFGAGFVSSIGSHIRGSLASVMDVLNKGLIGAGITGAGFVGWGAKLAADAEMAQVAFATMLQSGEKAKKLLSELKTFAIETPFEFPELRDGAKNLLAMGFAADEVVPTLRKLGDVSAGLNLPIGEMATLWGQFRTQNRIFTGDLRQLSTRGVSILSALKLQFGGTEASILKMAEEGKIEFKHLAKALDSLTGKSGAFHELMKTAAGTLAGQISTLKDQIADVAQAVGTALMPALKEITGNVSEAMPEIQSAAKSAGDAIAEAFSTDNIRTFADEMVNIVDAAKLLGAYFAEAQLGLLRLSKLAVQYNGITQGARLVGFEDEFQAAMSAFDAGIREAAEKATMIDPKTGQRVNRTDFIQQHFGERERPAPPTPAMQKYRERMSGSIDAYAKRAEEARKNTPLNKAMEAARQLTEKLWQPAMKQFADAMTGRTAGRLVAAGAGAAARAMSPDERSGFEGFSSFTDLNRNIQSALIKDNDAKKVAQNTGQQLKLTQATNNLLVGVQTAVKNFTIWAK